MQLSMRTALVEFPVPPDDSDNTRVEQQTDDEQDVDEALPTSHDGTPTRC